MSDKLFEITLQQSLELNGVPHAPGEVVEVPEWLYDKLVESYTQEKLTPQAVVDPGLQLLLTEEQE